MLTVMARNSAGTAIYTTTDKTHPVFSTNLNVPSSAYVLAPTTIGSIDVLGHAGRNLGSWYWNITDPGRNSAHRARLPSGLTPQIRECSICHGSVTTHTRRWGATVEVHGLSISPALISPAFLPTRPDICTGIKRTYLLRDRFKDIYDNGIQALKFMIIPVKILLSRHLSVLPRELFRNTAR